MGGSSLGPEVIKTTFGTISGFPELYVLDSTDPAQVKAFENRVDLQNTLFIVSSKSGSTLEPNVFKQYFFDRITRLVGPKEAGRRFLAITDPGSKMQQVAERDGFRRIFLGWPNIGGRYSVLSDFGLVPAAIMGVDVAKFLDRTEEMVCACMPSVPVAENPGVMLGTILGVAARELGRDKMTIVASPPLKTGIIPKCSFCSRSYLAVNDRTKSSVFHLRSYPVPGGKARSLVASPLSKPWP